MAEAGDARRLLKDLPAVGALDGQNLVDAPLADDGIAFPAQARVHEQLVDVLQAAGPAVNVVFALSGAVIPAGHRHLRLLHLEDALGVVQHKGDLGEAQALALFRAVEDHVLHLGSSEGAGGLFPHHPADGVGDIGFAGTVGAHHRRDVRTESQHRLVGKGLEPLYFQRLQVHTTTSICPNLCKRFSRFFSIAPQSDIVFHYTTSKSGFQDLDCRRLYGAANKKR